MGTKMLSRDRHTGKLCAIPLLSLAHDTQPKVAIAPGVDVVTWCTPLPVPPGEGNEATEKLPVTMTPNDWHAMRERLEALDAQAAEGNYPAWIR